MQKQAIPKEPVASYKEVRIGKTLYRVTSVFSGEKDLGRTLEQLAVRRAMTELDAKIPDWRARFPLPLYDEAARDLLNRLLEDATTSTEARQSGSPVSARRCLARRSGQDWELQARLDMPSRIDTRLGEHKYRLLSMRISSGQAVFEAVLKKHAQNDFYFFQQKKSFLFSGQDAAQEIRIRYTAPSGFCQSHVCPGGTELDTDLPWIFEGEQYDYRFRQQGGDELLALAGGRAVTDGDGRDPVAADHAQNLRFRPRLLRLVIRQGEVAHAGFQHLAVFIDNRQLAARAEARIDAQRDLAANRRLHQKLVQVVAEDADRALVRLVRQLVSDADSKQPLMYPFFPLCVPRHADLLVFKKLNFVFHRFVHSRPPKSASAPPYMSTSLL